MRKRRRRQRKKEEQDKPNKSSTTARPLPGAGHTQTTRGLNPLVEASPGHCQNSFRPETSTNTAAKFANT